MTGRIGAIGSGRKRSAPEPAPGLGLAAAGWRRRPGQPLHVATGPGLGLAGCHLEPITLPTFMSHSTGQLLGRIVRRLPAAGPRCHCAAAWRGRATAAAAPAAPAKPRWRGCRWRPCTRHCRPGAWISATIPAKSRGLQVLAQPLADADRARWRGPCLPDAVPTHPWGGRQVHQPQGTAGRGCTSSAAWAVTACRADGATMRTSAAERFL